jgi:hypothetical protein
MHVGLRWLMIAKLYTQQPTKNMWKCHRKEWIGGASSADRGKCNYIVLGPIEVERR